MRFWAFAVYFSVFVGLVWWIYNYVTATRRNNQKLFRIMVRAREVENTTKDVRRISILQGELASLKEKAGSKIDEDEMCRSEEELSDIEYRLVHSDPILGVIDQSLSPSDVPLRSYLPERG